MTLVSENQVAFEDLFVRAQAYTARGDLASAEKILLGLLRDGAPEDSSARAVQTRVALSEVYEEMERQDEADEVLLPYEAHALDSFPAHLRGLLLLAFGSRAYWHKNYLNSLTLLNAARELLEPLGDASNLVRVYYCLGRSFQETGEQARAREHYKIAIEWGRRGRHAHTVVLPGVAGLFPGVIAGSFAMRDVLARMERLKDSDATVLITGETGTGKELIARSLHEEGRRRDKIFLPFNCSAAPRDLLESQLFGHRRGTFTGAINDQRGIIRAAEGGTLFLDEIGDLALELQPKLLRFLQEGEIMPLGDSPRKVNVRVIAATNRDLELDVREGRFREDLFYRLNTFVIKVPPLRVRPEDIPALASYYFEKMCRRHHRRLGGLTTEAIGYLSRYSWPGNVRQLRNEIERVVVFADEGQSVGVESLSPDILRAVSSSTSTVSFEPDFSRPVNLKEIMLDVERQLLTEALARHGGNVTRAAEMLGLSRQTFNYKLRKFGLGRPELNLVEDED
ncbi:MAG TPA: sigma 54-interacting transcriptional regulator [Pyrinomonadaceae bacterium]|nr:sigma 54-interacting transcriptional regulator [Pyrinomonadaceae bacterium]